MMVRARLLVSSGSSMSVMAGLVSRGRVVVPAVREAAWVAEGWTRLDATHDVLRHSEVRDYLAVDEVDALLRTE